MNIHHLFHAQNAASLATFIIALPSFLGAQTPITQADIADTSSVYWDGANALWSLNGGTSYTNSGDLNFGTTNIDDNLAIGYSTTGNSLTISSGTVTDYTGYIGHQTGSTGTAIVTGAGSVWNNAHELYVGLQGTGTLNINDGGTVSNTTGAIGYDVGSNGSSVTVTGAGSTWTNSFLYVGTFSTGTLNINDGGTVTNTNGYIGYSSSTTGTVNVTGAGSVWNSNTIYVGNNGTGMVNIEAGGTVSTTGGRIGELTDSHGTVTVTGAGSTWTNSSYLYVGNSGTGTLYIGAGGKVSNTGGIIGEAAGSHGTVTVTGVGSTWTNSVALSVGSTGTGTLYINDSALVTATTVSVSSGSAIYLGGGYLALASTDATTDLNTLNALLDGGVAIYAWNGAAYELITSSLSSLISCAYYSDITTYDVLDGYNLTGGYTVLTSLYSIPEPSTYALFGGLGALGLALLRRRRK